jgi:hypothetical protein
MLEKYQSFNRHIVAAMGRPESSPRKSWFSESKRYSHSLKARRSVYFVGESHGCGINLQAAPKSRAMSAHHTNIQTEFRN